MRYWLQMIVASFASCVVERKPLSNVLPAHDLQQPTSEALHLLQAAKYQHKKDQFCPIPNPKKLTNPKGNPPIHSPIISPIVSDKIWTKARLQAKSGIFSRSYLSLPSVKKKMAQTCQCLLSALSSLLLLPIVVEVVSVDLSGASAEVWGLVHTFTSPSWQTVRIAFLVKMTPDSGSAWTR